MNAMLMNERRGQILSILQDKKFVTVKRLCELLYASPATIRRDLADMAAQGIISRLRGGAELIEGSNSEMPSELRLKKEKEKKEIIAALAAPYMADASTIMMDGSSTVLYLARQFSNYTGKSIITNGLSTVDFLNEHTNATAYCVGGRLFHQSAFVGLCALEAIASFRADVLFFSCCGFSAQNGCTEAEEESAAVKRAMIKSSGKKILLCDSTKFGNDFFCRTCGADSIDLIITDKMPDEKTVNALKNKLIYPE